MTLFAVRFCLKFVQACLFKPLIVCNKLCQCMVPGEIFMQSLKDFYQIKGSHPLLLCSSV